MSNGQNEWQDKKTLGSMLNEASAKYGDREAYVFGDERINYRELRERVDRLAGSLIRIGIKKGDKIAIWMPNCMEWVYTFFAAAKIGAIIVTVNTRFKRDEAAYIVGHSEATALFMYDNFLNIDYVQMLHELCPEIEHCRPGQLDSAALPSLRHVIIRSSSRCDGMHRFDDVMALGRDFPRDELERIEAIIDPFDVSCIMYTSGSTGFPKGVMLTHEMIRARLDVAERMELTEQDCSVLYVPLFHIYGISCGIIDTTLTGGRVVLMETYDCVESMRLMERERATLVYGMDPMYLDYLRHPDFEKYDLSSLRTGICPAGLPHLIPLMQEILGRLCKVHSSYGATELSSTAALTLPDDPPERICTTSGYPLPGYNMKIIDPQSRQFLPPNTVGEICVKGYGVMRGYYKRPEETAKTIDADGWLRTGDLASIDDQGYLRFARRLKETLRVGGENTDPIEIETVLMSHPAVFLAKVTGVPDKRLDEVAAAFVQLEPGRHVTEEELIRFCKGKVANFKVPRYVLLMAEFPMTASGKVQKFKLRQMAVQQLGLEER